MPSLLTDRLDQSNIKKRNTKGLMGALVEMQESTTKIDIPVVRLYLSMNKSAIYKCFATINVEDTAKGQEGKSVNSLFSLEKLS